GPCLSLETTQLGSQILELLPGKPRDVLLAQQGGAVTLYAVELLRQLRRSAGVRRIGLVGRWLRFLRREISRDIVQVGIAEVRRHRCHLRVLAVALAKLEKLRGDELRRLSR